VGLCENVARRGKRAMLGPPHPAPSTDGLKKTPAAAHPLPLEGLCDDPSLRVIPRSPPLLLANDDPSPEGFGPQGEESRTALKTLRARFLFRVWGIGMTA